MAGADGIWNINIKTPMGVRAADLTLATDGGALSGSLSAPAPLGNLEFNDGTVDGDNLAWQASVRSPMPMTLKFTATVAGDAISGEVKIGFLGTAEFEGQRG